MATLEVFHGRPSTPLRVLQCIRKYLGRVARFCERESDVPDAYGKPVSTNFQADY